MNFSKHLIDWYLKNKRELPWRQAKDPYCIWLSEIILQQTRIDQGLPYYNKFVAHYPTLNDLAKASEKEILKLWQGLGYYSRARNLHFSAKHIVNELNGVFPNTYKNLLQLKGIGDYTASAIASICFNEETAVVDGNVYRVLARFFGVETAINSSKGIKEFKKLAQELIKGEHPGTFNQAIMEFGARMCIPQNPNCDFCPVKNGCIAFGQNKIETLPNKPKKTVIKQRFFNYLVIETENNCGHLVKRKEGIWKNLYQFPLIETDKVIDEKVLFSHNEFENLFNNISVNIRLHNTTMVVHKLSHQTIFTKFWIVKLKEDKKFVTHWDTLIEYPVPKLIENFLKTYKSK
ncbi:A/G-specific adenine glycosylase [Lutibacter sp.]|uniref:A/G-specific adenine glycosylase n=1 Tax=Lutibacter sp. TaxID=1925666 RepID=UPI0027323704|nr:A/G-specific adenine glycosylase [Lutibacter sp.]MDP3312855.1 A/G-specific adenine glycosylase [Lutibacter sp.]